MERKNEIVAAGCGIVFMLGLLGGLLAAGFLPPPSPHGSAAAIARTYTAHTTRIRGGVIFASIACALLVPWYAVIAVHLRRIERAHRLLTYTFILAAAGGMMDFILPLLFMETAAFRPADAQFVQHLNDLGWICLVAGGPIFAVQAAVVAVAILQDQRQRPVFPRWSGYLSLWCVLLFEPGVFAVFFKTGPLAWRGVLSFWVPAAAFGVWIVALTVIVITSPGEQLGMVGDEGVGGLGDAMRPAEVAR
jgi:hypothetical protein